MSARDDKRRMDWLAMQVVRVDTPLRWGSRENFIATPVDSIGEVEPLYAASPNAGEVTEEELEKMLAAEPFGDQETVETIIIRGLIAGGHDVRSLQSAHIVIRAALSSLGIKVGG